MSEDTEVKQEYLRSQIIDKGYDPEKFSQYLQSVKGDNGLELNNWTFEELGEVVCNFQLSQEKKENGESEQKENKQNDKNKEKKGKPDINKSNFFQTSPQKAEGFDILTCQKQQRNDFTKMTDLQVNISKYNT